MLLSLFLIVDDVSTVTTSSKTSVVSLEGPIVKKSKKMPKSENQAEALLVALQAVEKPARVTSKGKVDV
jgi:hypothetical protein